MKLLLFLLRASRGAVALAVLAGAVCGASSVALIGLIGAALAGDGTRPTSLAWLFVGLCAIAIITRMLTQLSMARLAQGSVARLALHLCAKIQSLPLDRFEAIEPGGLITVLTEDVVIVSGALAGIPLLCINVPTVAGCLAYLGWLAPAGLVCALGLAVPAVIGYQALAVRGFRQLRVARAGQERLVGHFRALIDGFRELKVHRGRRDAFFERSLHADAATVRHQMTGAMACYAAAASWGQLAFFGVIGALLFVLPPLGVIDARALGGAVLAVLYLMSPLEVIVTWIPTLARAGASLLRIEALLPALEAGDGTGAARPLAVREAIRLADVTYTYKGSQGFVLGPLDLVIRPGEAVFVVGGNGSGKTTLVKVLTGLYRPDNGRVKVDGYDVSASDVDAYRQLFSVVFADGYVFGSLAGLEPHGLRARAHALLERLELGGLITITGEAFSTVDVSQGQRKRLALLVALLEDRPVMIFDELAASQDPHFKRVFYLELVPELTARGKAVIVISHDEEYFGSADRIIRLEGGGIRCDGEPAGIRSPAALGASQLV
jgi:putative ATP-binding cassette transporter